jgi:hypothetical protein
MINQSMIIEERQRDLGSFLVGRLLPFRKKRSVGPFVFIDHMGPVKVSAGNGLKVDQHPHIGLSTLTYLLDGEIKHRDSTGAVQIVGPGDVGFMTSGKGVTHTERSPESVLQKGGNLHGYQIWVGLPTSKEEMEPRFDFVPSDDIPEREDEFAKVRVVAGESNGLESPLPVHSPLFMLDVTVKQNGEVKLEDLVNGEIAIVVTSGQIDVEGETIGSGKMLVSKTREYCRISSTRGSRLLIFGGEPFPEERYLLWNFASSSKDRLQQAKTDWIEKRFPKVPGDDTYVPFP